MYQACQKATSTHSTRHANARIDFVHFCTLSPRATLAREFRKPSARAAHHCTQLMTEMSLAPRIMGWE